MVMKIFLLYEFYLIQPQLIYVKIYSLFGNTWKFLETENNCYFSFKSTMFYLLGDFFCFAWIEISIFVNYSQPSLSIFWYGRNSSHINMSLVLEMNIAFKVLFSWWSWRVGGNNLLNFAGRIVSQNLYFQLAWWLAAFKICQNLS